MKATARSTHEKGWAKPSRGADYAGKVTLKTFRGFLKDGMRHARLPNGRILIRYEWIDQYLQQFEVEDRAKDMAEELTENL